MMTMLHSERHARILWKDIDERFSSRKTATAAAQIAGDCCWNTARIGTALAFNTEEKIKRAAQRNCTGLRYRSSPFGGRRADLCRFEDAAARLVYNPASVPFLKRIAAVSPQHGWARGRKGHVDGVVTDGVTLHNARGRFILSKTHVQGTTQMNSLFSALTTWASFDSPYIGPIFGGAVVDVAKRDGA